MLMLAAEVHAQEIDLRGLFRQSKTLDMAVGYEVDRSWPRPHAGDAEAASVSAVEVDRSGAVWTLQRGRVPVQVFDADGKLIRSWGEGLFRKPHGLALDREDCVWITDIGAHTVTRLSPDGEPQLQLGTPGEPGNDATHFNQPTDVAIASDGTVYVSDGYGNNRVVIFDRDGNYLKQFGEEGAKPGQFRLPHALVIDAQDRLYVADRSNARIQVFDAQGTFLAQWRNLVVPWDLALAPDGAILACGSSPMRWPRGPQIGVPLGIPPKDQLVMKLDASGRVLELWTFAEGAKEPGALDWVHGLGVDASGNLYLGDIEGHRVQKFRRLGAELNDAAILRARDVGEPGGAGRR